MLMGAAVSVFHADRVSRRQHSGRHTDGQTSPCEVESSSKARGPGRVSCCTCSSCGGARMSYEGTRLSVLQGATLLRDCTVLIRGQRSLCIIRCLCWTAEYSAFLGRVSSHYANIYGSRGAIAPGPAGALSNTAVRRAAQCTLGWLNSSRYLNLNILFDAESMCRRKRACER
jgi:hypothetical protein